MSYTEANTRISDRQSFKYNFQKLLVIAILLFLVFISCNFEEKYNPIIGQFYILDNNSIADNSSPFSGSLYLFDNDSIYYYINTFDKFGSAPYSIHGDSIFFASMHYHINKSNEGFTLRNKNGKDEYKAINVNAGLDYDINSYRLSKSKFDLYYKKMKLSLSEPIYNNLELRLLNYLGDSSKSTGYVNVVTLNHLYLGRQSIIKIPTFGVFVLNRNEKNEIIATGYSEIHEMIIEAKLMERKAEMYERFSLNGMNWVSSKFSYFNIIENNIKAGKMDTSFIEMYIGSPSEKEFLINRNDEYQVEVKGENDQINVYINSIQIESLTLLNLSKGDELILVSDKFGSMENVELSIDSSEMTVPIELTLLEGANSYLVKRIEFNLMKP